jgi:hypothetical protein
VRHYVFHFSTDPARGLSAREQAAELMRVQMWGVSSDEPHRDALAPGDLTLIYLAKPESEFIGRAEIAWAVRDWTPSEAEAFPGESPSGVLLARIEEWAPPVRLSVVVERIDPTGSNPYVQANARDGFPMGVVGITASEYQTVLTVHARSRQDLIRGCER